MKIKNKYLTGENGVLLLLGCFWWMIDNFTSIYFINKYPQYFIEANPIAAYFFAMSWPGYIMNFILCISIITFVILFFPVIYIKATDYLSGLISRLLSRSGYSKANPEELLDKIRVYRILITGILIGLESFVILHNFSIMNSYGIFGDTTIFDKFFW